MDFLLGIAGSLVGKIIELTVESVCCQVGYIFNYKSNIASLETEVNNLSGLRTEMQQNSERATRNLETIHDNVEEWMRSAERAFEDAEDFLKNYEEHAKAKCSIWYFPNLVLRHELSKEAKKKADSIAKLCASIPQDPISSAKVLPSSDEMIEGYEAFESRNSIMNQIMDALRNPEVQVVGLHGMGGVGKTMLAKEVSRRARLDKVFDIDVMVTVSHDQNPKNIQQHIAEKLCLELDDKTLSARADKLRLRLRQERKNILLILDDVWDKLDLQEIGVSIGNNQNGCKILLTSKSAKVCSLMKAGSTTFMLEALPKKEATELFNKNVGDSARGPNFENLAKEIIKECAGLPIAIVVVASALYNRGEEVWEDVLLELKTSPANIEGLDEKVYSSIKVSYNHLPNENAKKLLLLCSLHAEDEVILIEDLVKYGLGLSWFYNTKRLKEVRNRVYHLVVTLKERSLLLLLDGIEGTSVKLHDVIRDVCLSIASQDKDMHFIRDIDHLEEFIQNEKLKEATGISLPIEAINHLPEKFEWPHLKLLLLREGKAIVKIMDEHCFKEMKNLRVLYLINIDVNPTCFSSLQKLQTLCLRNCLFLGDIAPIGELNKLKILDLSESDFLKLPKEIGKLTQLQLLDVSLCSTLRYVEPHVLSNLNNLEHLHMTNDFGEWGVEGVISNENASLVELNDLDKLTALYVTVPNVNSLPKFWLSNKMHLERYQIWIGDWDNFVPIETKTSKALLLKLVKSHQVKAHGLEKFIGTAEMLHLEGFRDFNDILELDNEGFQHVENFSFQRNEGVRYFINRPYPCRAFLSLKSLHLYQMRNLEKICHGKLISGSFGKLKKVTVKECKRLKSLFSFSIARHFEQIQMASCQELQEIGTHENEHESQNAINDSMNETKSCELETLKLVDLPKLTRFFWPEQEINSISDWRDGLFNNKVVFSKLRKMELSYIKVVNLWPDELHGASFMQNLTTLKVTDCRGLNYLSSFDVAKSLELLESLELRNLEALKVVIVVKKQLDEVERMEKKLFPKLHTLQLINLPNMEEFCSQCCFEFPSLKVLRIEKCPKVADVLDLIGMLSNLEVLDLYDSSFVELPFMQNLTTLKVTDCRGLNYLSSFDVAKSLELLESLVLRNLDALKVVIVVKKQLDEVERMEKKLFPKLHTLQLINLPNMEEFCSQCCFEFPSLKVLRIKKCPKVVDVLNLIVKSSNLEVLDLSYSSFLELPQGIERLTQLKTLDLSGCKYLKVIQPDVISELIHLEKLKMLKSHVTWGGEGVSTGTKRSSVSLSELKNLPQLTALELSVPDFSFLPKDFFSEKWKDCKITTNKGSYISFFVGFYFSSKLEILLKKREIIVWECGLQVFLKRSEALLLDGLEDNMDDIVYELDKEGFPQLRELKLRNNNGVRYLVNSIRHSSTAAFVSVESLDLCNLTTLERICHGELIRGSFGKLTSVKVANCARLKSLFPISVATQLEVLRVENCEAMEAIFTIEREDDNDLAFTELKNLSLENLPRLVQFCSKLKTTSTSHWKDEPSEEELGISMSLFDAKVQMPNLSELVLEKIGCKQIWHHQPSPILNNLITLEVSDCHNLKRLMPYSMVTNLKSLKVSNCENMQELVSMEKEEENLISFNKLETLWLKNLRSLRRFDAIGTVNFPSLSEMTLKDCFKLNTLIPGSTKAPQRETFFGGEVNLPNLERLSVDNCEIIDEIFDLKDQSRFDKLENFDLDNKLVIPKPMHMCGKNLHLGIGKGNVFQDLVRLSINRCNRLKSLATPSVYFHYLIELEVSGCNGLMKLFSSSTIKGMVSLQKITIFACKGMTEIIGNDHEGIVESEIVLEQLRDLYLFDLPNLRCFYSGNSTITFPYLDVLVVSRCFEMKTFSHGIVNSPFLDSISILPKSKEKEEKDDGQEQDWGDNINSTIQKIYKKWRKKSESSSNEQITSEKDTTMGNNEDELSTELTELSGGDQVKRDSWKGKELATKSSSSSSNSAFFKRWSSF